MDQQVGNPFGVLSVGYQRPVLAAITADSVTDNIIEVDRVDLLHVGQVIDIVNESTGAELAVDRTITKIEDNGGTFEVTYSGADVDPTTAHSVYLANSYAGAGTIGQSGGPTARQGYVNASLVSIQAMRDRLAEIDAAYYTAAKLNELSYNDMVYAIRLNDDAATVG